MMEKFAPGLFTLAVVALVASAAPSDRAAAQRPTVQRVSFIELLARPSEFAGKRVMVFGVFSRDLDDQWLFHTKEALDGWDVASAVRLKRSDVMIDDAWSGTHIIVEGTFMYEKSSNRKWIEQITNVHLRGRVGTTPGAKKPNKSPEPTPTAVTPRATESRSK